MYQQPTVLSWGTPAPGAVPTQAHATIDQRGGVSLRFPYVPWLVETVKAVGGFKWQKPAWLAAHQHSLHAVGHAAAADGHALHMVLSRPFSPAPPVVGDWYNKLKPHQQWGVDQLINNPRWLLLWEQRTGKTRTLITAASSVLAAGLVKRVLVLAPSTVMHEWGNQLKDHVGLTLTRMRGDQLMTPEQRKGIAELPYQFIALPYENLKERGDDLQWFASLGPYAVLADEPQYIKEKKAPRTMQFIELGTQNPNARFVWAASGSPMRNRPADMWPLFEFLGSGGTYWTWAKRYNGAFENTFGWELGDVTNAEELSSRLAAISTKLSRRDVVKDIPRGDYKVIRCDFNKSDRKSYEKLEKVLGPKVMKELRSTGSGTPAGMAALRQLVGETMKAKAPVAIARLREHTEIAGHKVLVFTHTHEALKTLEAQLVPEGGAPPILAPVFCAGGWKTPDKRAEIITAWRDFKGPSVLLANILSSGIGIDLADAAVALLLELSWVPSDMLQTISRLFDIHLGKMKEPPIFEALLAANTVDESTTLAMLKKLRNIEAVVGEDVEGTRLAEALRAGEIVENSNLGLSSTAPEVVAAALGDLRTRLLAGAVTTGDANTALAGQIAEAFEETEAPDDAPMVEESP